MLTKAEFVAHQISLGSRIHENDGVWWDEVYPCYCKPAFIYHAFDPGTARPMRRHSLLGYSHQVVTNEKGNRQVSLMVLEGNDLRNFSLSSLGGPKNRVVRQGLSACEIRPIVELEAHLEQMRSINLSQSLRQQEGGGAETPAKRYRDEADEWRVQVRREFALGGREWWGAFREGLLIAYVTTYQVEGVRVIEKVKSHSDYLVHRPVDALTFSILEASAREASCQRVINGSPQHRSLNRYKEQFLFRATEYPYFSTYAALVEWAKRVSTATRRLDRS